ncbi:GatB/YqeY domain-containing protein [Isachenkonia alkalipeptolytica]|uniref:GatB/YqeY domain-containing protein n=1 Tax=Isachenkonia alkalipeptolytica TaxID=2565777 RepID=A0AA43XKI3_9CLOT|nr:GatB/YqeY domain-containing protein [Isachenkonia alkalipeptolytica]NBG87939.1 GatB/YqeY domain-containing protein [Isachenkonia alkalipeptolytica]
MNLKEKLTVDLKTAMKEKNKVKKDVITMIRSDIKQWEVDKRQDVSDEEVIQIISKQVKQRKDSIEDFEKSGREDLVEQNRKEIEILQTYLPKQLTEEEIRGIVKEAIEKVQPESKSDMGKIMGMVMPQVKGRGDGKLVNKIVNEELNFE